ncbi:hypothetical protein [Paraburkholderia sp. 32]|uniref:hypothetical protein n=1 Tax=Paraburkholderia sp. 32 TaxID=2991057 RepID=UPI003D22CE1F
MKIYLIVLFLFFNVAFAKPQDNLAPTIINPGSVEVPRSVTSTASGSHEIEGLKKSKVEISRDSPQSLDSTSADKDFVGLKAWLLKLINDPIALFTLVLAIYTFQLSRTTTRLWREAKSAGKTADESAQAAKIAADSAKRTVDAYMMAERAWVSLVGTQTIQFENAIDINNQLHSGTQFHLQWKNTGKTPARNVILHSNKKIILPDEGEPSFQFDATGENMKQGVLFPEALVTTPPQQFVLADIERLKKREIRIFVYGYAEYSDVYSEQHTRHTEVCLEIRYDGVENGRNRFVLTQSTSHNSVL